MTLECRSVSFSYNGRNVLKNISFQVGKGIFCAILGRNGSGKTTLLHCLNGILKPAGGHILVDGLDLGRMPQTQIARHVSMVPQEHTDIFPFSVIDFVVMGRTPFLKMTRSPGPTEYRMALDALKTLNADYLARRNYNQISGGERQIALLARALLQSSSTILLDEPTNHLDFKNQYRMLSRMKGLCRDHNTRIIASMHDPNLAMMFSDQVVMLKHGRIIAQGKTDAVMTGASVGELYDTSTQKMGLQNSVNIFLPADIVRENTVSKNKDCCREPNR